MSSPTTNVEKMVPATARKSVGPMLRHAAGASMLKPASKMIGGSKHTMKKSASKRSSRAMSLSMLDIVAFDSRCSIPALNAPTSTPTPECGSTWMSRRSSARPMTKVSTSAESSST